MLPLISEQEIMEKSYHKKPSRQTHIACPECGGKDIFLQAKEEKERIAVGDIVLMIILLVAFPVVGWGIFIAALFFGGSTKTVTCATCQDCGYIWTRSGQHDKGRVNGIITLVRVMGVITIVGWILIFSLVLILLSEGLSSQVDHINSDFYNDFSF